MGNGFQVLVGVDEGTESYECFLIAADGKTLRQRSVKYDAAAITGFLNELSECAGGDPQRVAIAIERPHGVMVEAALERGFAVFSINPKQLDRFRDRHCVAGAKDDSRDGYVLGDSLRTDQHLFHRVRLDAPLTIQLRGMTHAEEELGKEAGRLSNQLREQLHRFYPQALALCPAADEPWLWDLLLIAPTPQAGQRLRFATVEGLLRRKRIRRFTAYELLEKLKTPPLPVAPGVVEASSARVGFLLPRLALVEKQRKKCQTTIEKILEKINEEEKPDPEKREHRDVDILRSFPGLGRSVVATMLAEASQPLKERNYHALRTQTGIAPVTKQSGKRKPLVRMRYACNWRLRNTVYHWTRVATQVDAAWLARYNQLRQKGLSHPRALRSIGDYLLRCLIAALRTGTLYDPSRRLPVSP